MAVLQACAQPYAAPVRAAVPLTTLGRSGAGACGDVELLAIATGSRLPQAALVVERLGGLQGVAAPALQEPIGAGPAPGRAATLAAGCEIGRRGSAALPEG